MIVSPMENDSARLGSHVYWCFPFWSSATSSGAALRWGCTEVGGFVIEDGLHVVVLFVGPAVDVGQLDLPIFVDEDVLRAHIAELLLSLLEVLGSGDGRIQQVPYLALVEKLVEALAVIDFVGEQVRVVFVEDLTGKLATFTMPVEPQRPSFWNSKCSGSSRFSLLHSSRSFCERSQSRNSRSAWTGTCV